MGSYCIYREIVRAILSTIQDEDHKGSNCIVNLADTYNSPCIGLDEEGRKRGIEDVFGLSK